MDTWNAQEYYMVYLTLIVFEEHRTKTFAYQQGPPL